MTKTYKFPNLLLLSIKSGSHLAKSSQRNLEIQVQIAEFCASYFFIPFLTTILTLLLNTNLAGANLVGCNLQHADLTGSNLIRADVTGANLDGAIFTKAYLEQIQGMAK